MSLLRQPLHGQLARLGPQAIAHLRRLRCERSVVGGGRGCARPGASFHISKHASYPGQGPSLTLRPYRTHAKPRKQGRSSIHILPAECAGHALNV